MTRIKSYLCAACNAYWEIRITLTLTPFVESTKTSILIRAVDAGAVDARAVDAGAVAVVVHAVDAFWIFM